MKVTIELCRYAPCTLRVFEVNGIKASVDDFGDTAKDNVGNYTCDLEGFKSKAPEDYVLAKYGITKEEFQEVCQQLDEAFDYGMCSYCK